MFQFRPFPTYTYLIQCTLPRYCRGGFPHSEISGSMDICSSPKLFACSRCELCRQFFREIVIVTHLYDVPQLKYTLLCLFRHRTSLLPYFTLLLHCSVFKVHCPITFAIRFEDPTFQSGLQIQQQTLFGGPEWARTTDLAIISRTL